MMRRTLAKRSVPQVGGDMGQIASPGSRPRVKPFGPSGLQGWPNPFTLQDIKIQ